MTKSEQIKQEPDPTGQDRSRQIFQNFTEATIALLKSPDTPKELSEALTDAITVAGNQIGRLPGVEVTRETLSWILDLNSVVQAEDGEATTAADDTERAAEELAKAFVTLAQHHNYLPADLCEQIGDRLTQFCDGQWQSKPDVMRKVLPHILREAIANETK